MESTQATTSGNEEVFGSVNKEISYADVLEDLFYHHLGKNLEYMSVKMREDDGSGCMVVEEYIEEGLPALSSNNVREEATVRSFCYDDDILAGPSSPQSTECHVETKSTGMQTTCSSIAVNSGTEEINNLTEQIKILQCQIDAYLPLVQFEQRLGADDEMCKFYTGLSLGQLQVLRRLCEVEKINYWGSSISDPDIKTSTKPQGRSRTYTQVQELILLLITLKVGLRLEDIAYRFSLSSDFVKSIVITWLLVLYSKFNCLRPQMFPSREDVKERLLTNRFRKFKNIRAIIDCVEIRCNEGNPDFECSDTYKFLIGCSPNGAVTFVSDAMEKSGLINLLEDGDLVLADRGFTRGDDGSTSKIPALLKVRDILVSREVMETNEVHANRLFNEHIADRLESFIIFQDAVPLFLRPMLSEAVFVCACLLNF